MSELVTGRDPAASLSALHSTLRELGHNRSLSGHEPFSQVLGTVESRFQPETSRRQVTDPADVDGVAEAMSATAVPQVAFDFATKNDIAPLPQLLVTHSVSATVPEPSPGAAVPTIDPLEEECSATEIALAAPAVQMMFHSEAVLPADGVSELEVSGIESVDASPSIANATVNTASFEDSAGENSWAVRMPADRGRGETPLAASEVSPSAMDVSTAAESGLLQETALPEEAVPELTVDRRSPVSRGTENYRQIARAGLISTQNPLDDLAASTGSVPVGEVSNSAADEIVSAQQSASLEQDFGQSSNSPQTPFGEWTVFSLEEVNGTDVVADVITAPSTVSSESSMTGLPTDLTVTASQRGSWHRFADLIAKESIQVEASAPHRLQLRLEPSQLGEMVIDIQKSSDGQYEIRLAVSSSETQSLLADRTNDIRQALKERGLEIQQFDVDSSLPESRRETGTANSGAHGGSSGSQRMESPEVSMRPLKHRPQSKETDVSDLNEVNFRA